MLIILKKEGTQSYWLISYSNYQIRNRYGYQCKGQWLDPSNRCQNSKQMSTNNCNVCEVFRKTQSFQYLKENKSMSMSIKYEYE